MTDEDKVLFQVGDRMVDAWGREEQEEVNEDDVSPYDGWKKAELVQEIRNRNEGREEEDQLDEEGKVAALRARLEADDEAHEE